ncbi:MAG: TIR domain-containing protein [Xenococcaceae cyanobacterium MO_207.B15]|nr:TIR domain-containing protein [Xenococcaceae cyanobacterium MO_207.B15]
MKQFFDVFISYGRADSKAFAIKLNQRLIAQGLNVWFDQEDIPLGVDYQEQINSGIEKTHNFVFIIAPHSVNSKYCLKEINLAIQYNKRIIPILHVEQISQETWQSRNINKTIDDWREYQAKGLDSSFPNMHPAISKINWVYCRENIDNFEASFNGLINVLSRDRDYVAKHSQLLVQALDWFRNQKQTNYLLIGRERQEAENWLKCRFADEQKPCLPTDLHCEFISESIKNANNLMTQVFLSASEKDCVLKEKIGKTLMREGLTIWTNQTDIKTGTAFKNEINKGIQGADNFVYFISLDTLRSHYCQEELTQAFAYNKRIIPLLIQEIDLNLIPPKLQELQFIDLTKSEDDRKYRRSIDKLLKALKSDAYYYENHKLLLVKALKWQRQNRNPSILLRSYNLQHFEAWLTIAQQRRDYPPLPLQQEFIAESLKQPEASSLEVFISYSRADSDFARKLNDALMEVGKLTWFDQESIASGTDFQQEIYRGIENCDNFLFIISSASVNSPYCADEVEYAHKLNKRFVTIVYQQVSPKDLHPVLAKIQWIDFNQHGGDFSANFPELVRTIDTDREHVHSHTKWSQRAREWSQKDKNPDLLLRGSEFVLANNWLEETLQENKQPTATDLQKEFIATSQKAIEADRQAEKRRQEEILHLQEERTKEAEARLAEEKKYARRQKIFSGIATVGFMITTALGLAALYEYRKSKINEIKAMSLSSEALFASEKKLKALIEAIKAKRKLQKVVLIAGKDAQIKVKHALQKVVYTIKQYNRLSGHYGAVLGVAFSPDHQLIASGSADNTVILWKWDGTLLNIFKGHEGSVNAVAFSPDSQFIASASVDNTIKLWTRDGTLLRTFEGHNDFNRVAFSADGSTLALASKDQTVQLWNWNGNQATLITTLKGDNQKVGSFNSVAFSPDNQLVGAGSEDKTIKIWKRNGTFLTTLKGHTDQVWGIAFSPNSQLIASTSEDTTIKIWKRDGSLVTTLKGHRGPVRDVAFSPDGQRIVSASQDQTLKLWQIDGTLLMTLRGHRDQVTTVDFSPDGKFIISGSADNSVRIWQPDNSLLQTLFGHRKLIKSVDFSPNGNLIVSGSEDSTVKLWQKDGKLLNTLKGHSDRVYGVTFSPDSQLIASASADQTVKLWQIYNNNKDAKLLNTFKGHNDRVYGVDFSPDGQLIASASADQTIKLWQKDGKLLKTLVGHKEEVNAVLFSPDGKFIISGSGDNTVKIWNINGTLLNTLEGHKSTVFALDISPNGKFIISGSGDNTVKIWNINGTLLNTLEGHTDSVLGVKFRPNFSMIASASVDKTIKLWQWDGNKAILETTLMGHSDAVQSIDFSPDGKTLSSGGNDRTVILWNKHSILNPNDLLVHGCNWVENYLKHNRAVENSDRTLCDGINLNQHKTASNYE